MSLNLPDFPVSPNEAIAALVAIGPLNVYARKRDSYQAAWALVGYAGGRVFTIEAAAPATPTTIDVTPPVLKMTVKLSREDGFVLCEQIYREISAPPSEVQRLQLLDRVKIEQIRQLFHWGIDLIADLAKASV